jgi:hypothetical protein
VSAEQGPVSGKVIGELEFLRKLQRLLAEGDFVATYKFALLNALADLSLERELEADGSLRVPVSAIAEKFIEYYWPQARPYRAVGGSGFVLFQNTGKQAAVVNAIAAAQVAHATLPVARAAKLRWHTLVTKVAGTIVTMPLWKLQTVGGERDEFLYREAEQRDDTIRLLPGVPAAFRPVAHEQRVPGRRITRARQIIERLPFERAEGADVRSHVHEAATANGEQKTAAVR